MIRYNDILKEIGYDKIKEIYPIYKYYGYKNGEVKIFDSEKDVKEFSYRYERFLENEKEISENKKERLRLECEAHKLWKDSVIDFYTYEISKEKIEICFNYVWEEYHSFGRDEVFDKLDDVVTMVRNILNLN